MGYEFLPMVVVQLLQPHGQKSLTGYNPWDSTGKNTGVGTSLVVQWLRLHAPNAGGPGFDPWSGK